MREDSQKILYLLEITWRLKRHLTVKNEAKNFAEMCHLPCIKAHWDKSSIFEQKLQKS